MSVNLQNNRNSIKESKDKYLMKQLCDQLNIDFFNILGFDPGFIFYGSFVDKGFGVYAAKRSKYSIEFRFSTYYSEDSDVLKNDDFDSELTDQELSEIADERRTLAFIFIEYVNVRSPGHGVGTLLVKSFLKRVKDIYQFKKIYLHPKDIRAKKFWRSVGFRDRVLDDLKYNISLKGEMAYDLDMI